MKKWIIIGIIVVAVIILTVWLVKRYKKNKAAKEAASGKGDTVDAGTLLDSLQETSTNTPTDVVARPNPMG